MRTEGRTPALVSVIVPAFNAAETLGEQLDALAEQTYEGSWELLISDNGSTDSTVAVARRWSHLDVPLTVVDASQRRGASHARNTAVAAASGELLAFCDADDIADRAWLTNLVRVAADHAVVAGTLEVETLNRTGGHSARERPVHARLDATDTTAPFAPSGNFAVWADVFDEVGGFDPDVPRAQDVELSQRLQNAGHEIALAPDAVVHYRFRSTTSGIAAQAFRSGRAAVQLYALHGPELATRRSGVDALRAWGWQLVRLPYLVMPSRRGLWVRRGGELVGRLWGSVVHRTWYP